MYFKYGSFQHDDNVVNLVRFNKRRVKNQRGFYYKEVRRMAVRVEVIGVGTTAAQLQANLKTQIDALEDAYSKDGFDAGLYHDDDTISAHALTSGDSLSGVQVVGFDYNQASGAEYSTQRIVDITLEAEYARQDGGNLMSFQETIRIIGTGGPRHAVIEVLNGSPKVQRVAQRTVIRATQTGTAIGHLGPPSNEVPPPIWADWEHEDRREITEGSPKTNRNSFTEFPISWSYHFSSPDPLVGSPNRK